MEKTEHFEVKSRGPVVWFDPTQNRASAEEYHGPRTAFRPEASGTPAGEAVEMVSEQNKIENGNSIQSPPADGLIPDVPSSLERAEDDVPPGLERWLQPGANPEEVRANTKQRLFDLESMREGRIPMSPNEEDEWKALKDSELWLKK